ncbi:MAG: OmpH family outer membrane protein [Rhizomicrobium sp.]|jgi:Skp family chaperone for outer membrane proteins
MSKTILSGAAAVAAGASMIFLSGTAVRAAPPPPAAAHPAATSTPEPRILVIDRNAILRASKAGQSIVAQLQGFTKSAEAEFKAQGEGLRKEGEALRAQVAILAPDVKARKIKDFQAKEAAFQKKVQDRQGDIQGGLYKARQQVEDALGPILKGLMNERHGNLLLDRSVVVLGTIDVDITAAAVQRLNQKLPSVKVTLQPLPPQVQAQLAAQEAQQAQQGR